MSLLDYQPERHEVVLKGGSFFVTGLSLNSLATLIKTHLTDLETVFELIDGSFSGDVVEVRKLATKMASEAPGLVANIIAMAAGEPGASTQAAQLPFPVQVQTLVEIGRLTFDEVGGVKKAMVTLLDLLGHLNPNTQDAPKAE